MMASGFEQHKEWLNLLVSVLNLVATISIPFLLWWYGRQQEKQQQQQAAQQRLQGHVGQLSDAGSAAMKIISSFKDDCESLGVSYTDVYKRKNLISGPAAAITRQQLQEVDHARSKLQGIWDNIMDDYRAGLLGGPITSQRHGRMLRRALTYMELVEPLEAANFSRLQAVNSRVASEGPYVMPASTASNIASSPLGPGIKCRFGARPSRFRWLENQKTLQLTGKALWKGETVRRCCGAKQYDVTCYRIDPLAAQALEQEASVEHRAWQQALVKQWAVLQQACTPLTAPAGAGPAAAEHRMQVLVTDPSSALPSPQPASAHQQGWQVPPTPPQSILHHS